MFPRTFCAVDDWISRTIVEGVEGRSSNLEFRIFRLVTGHRQQTGRAGLSFLSD